MSLKRKYDDLQLEYAKLKIGEANQPFILYVTESMEAVIAKRLLLDMMDRNVGLAVLLVGRESGEYRFYASAKEIDVKMMLESLKSSFVAKGGGNREMIQGSISISEGQMREFLQEYVNN